jgi:O-antigen ligase
LSAHVAAAEANSGGAPLAAALARAVRCSWLAITIALAIVAACFYASGGLGLSSATTTEMILTLGSGALVIAAALQRNARATPLFGGWTVGAFFLLAAFTGLSVGWSVEGSNSWIEAGRTLSYAACFAGSVALARLAAGRWRSVIAGVLLASAFISLYALGTKVFPGSPGINIDYARLNAPFNYWNVVGLTAALGVPAALWLGTRREGHGALAALAPPLICVALVTIMLSYSRGALLALVVGLIFWFVFVPLRLRSTAMLAVGAAGAIIAVAWDLSQAGLTTDFRPGFANTVPWSAHVSSGHELGGILLGVLIGCAVGGLLVRFVALRNPPSAELRERIGRGLLVCVALVPVVAVIGLAASSRGLFGSISHDVNTLTNTNVSVPNSATRLTALGSERAVYWRDAIDAWKAAPFVGDGAGSYVTTHTRYDPSPLTVTQAHGYIFQTLGDLGLVGLAFSLLLAGAWRAAALRATGPLRVRSAPGAPERIGLLTMITVVLIFAVHSTFDFDWFVPGAMMIALLCAGWVAGRGPHTSELALGRPDIAAARSDPWVASIAAATLALALVIAWTQWQPLRSYDSYNAAEIALANHHYVLASADARTASSQDPVDFWPIVWLAYAQFDMHHERAAYATMVRAVRLQPSNPQTWYQLALFDWYSLDEAKAALQADQRALFLDPQDDQTTIDSLYTTLLPAAQT